uniref:Uncharacterized protein n=1 Tax=Oryza punctata TaxID=4537 RepID=A0A0E0KKY3_ORYPU
MKELVHIVAAALDGRAAGDELDEEDAEGTSLLSVSSYVLRYSGSTYPAALFPCVSSDPELSPPAILANPTPASFAVSVSVRSTFDDRMFRKTTKN